MIISLSRHSIGGVMKTIITHLLVEEVCHIRHGLVDISVFDGVDIYYLLSLGSKQSYIAAINVN